MRGPYGPTMHSGSGRILPTVDLNSDPHAWLRPYYIALKNDGAFWMLAARSGSRSQRVSAPDGN